MKGIDFEETFSSVPRLEEIRMFLAFSCFNDFKVYELDLKSTLLNGNVEEEFYIEQTHGFILSDKQDYACKLRKELYGLKEAPRSCFSKLDKDL